MVINTIMSRHEVDTLIKSLIRRFMDVNRKKSNPVSISHTLFMRQSIPWEFSNSMTKAAGYAYHRGDMKFSAKIFAEMTKEERYNTIAHETAHVIQNTLYKNSKPHGPEWKSIMIDLGYVPKIYHNTIIKEQRQFTASCKCRSHAIGKIRYGKMARGVSQYRCRVCKSHIKIKK